MIRIVQRGSFRNTEKMLQAITKNKRRSLLERYAQQGVAALSAATPKDTGATANSWTYEIEDIPGHSAIYWKNSNVVDGVNVALILQYGHATKDGGYFEGIDYINPAMRPILEKLGDEAWKELMG